MPLILGAVFSQVGLPGPVFTQRHHPRTDLDALSSKTATRAPHEARNASKNTFLKISPGLRPGPRFFLLSLPSSDPLAPMSQPAPHTPGPSRPPPFLYQHLFNNDQKNMPDTPSSKPETAIKNTPPNFKGISVITFFSP